MGKTYDVRPDELIVVSQTRRLVAWDGFPRGPYMGVEHAGLPAGVPTILPRPAADLAASMHEDVEIVDVGKGELPEMVSSAFGQDIRAWQEAGPQTAEAHAPRSRKGKTAA